MSTAQMEAFSQTVLADESLQVELMTRFQELQNQEAFCEYVIQKGSEKGYTLTATEIEATLNSLLFSADASGELDDDALEQVAGGMGKQLPMPKPGIPSMPMPGLPIPNMPGLPKPGVPYGPGGKRPF